MRLQAATGGYSAAFHLLHMLWKTFLTTAKMMFLHPVVPEFPIQESALRFTFEWHVVQPFALLAFDLRARGVPCPASA